MNFIKELVRNLGLLAVIAIALFLLFPQQMKQIMQLYGALFGPIAILLVIVAALPRKRRGRGR